MKNSLLFLIVISITLINSQTENSLRNLDGINKKTLTATDIIRFKTDGFVSYSDFGAKGDGKTNDIDAIAETHDYANQNNLLVKADNEATYYIGEIKQAVIIKTDTDFGTAEFIIDDREIENHKTPIFIVSSNLKPFKIKSITSLKRNQEKIDATLPSTCLITVINSKVKHYIRLGLNRNNGSPQTDIFIADKDGNIDMDAPIIWDFDNITRIDALPIDKKILNISGGRFTTMANNAESKYNYYSRNISIRRSNVVINGLEHNIIGEGNHGAPYQGFITIVNCAYVTVKNTVLTGHKTYRTIGASGKPVSMGTYDLSVNRALNISFVNCSQKNDINSKKYWGIMASNYSKNLLYDKCTLSRFDAHQGVANATIRNSTLGHAGINAIGSGVLTIENTTIQGTNLINLRRDYGSTWQGNIIIRNCVFIPAAGKSISSALINGSYSGQHNFGYTCYMPQLITIENLHIDDSNHPKDYIGLVIFEDFNPKKTNNSYFEKFPYVLTKKVNLKNVTTASGKKLRLSNNLFMFKNVELITE